MTYYNCAKFRSRSVFNFGVSRGLNVSENTLGPLDFLGLTPKMN